MSWQYSSKSKRGVLSLRKTRKGGLKQCGRILTGKENKKRVIDNNNERRSLREGRDKGRGARKPGPERNRGRPCSSSKGDSGG